MIKQEIFDELRGVLEEMISEIGEPDKASFLGGAMATILFVAASEGHDPRRLLAQAQEVMATKGDDIARAPELAREQRRIADAMKN